MRIHVLQHVPFEGVGSILPWAEAQAASITTTQFFASTHLPSLSDIDMVIALGGPMSVNDEATLPWLIDEKRFIKAAIELGKPVLGICLGAQLIASAFGARVYPGKMREIGWFPVFAQPAQPQSDCFVFPEQVEVFHWHGDTFDLPKGAIHLARSQACLHQAFQIGARAIGLQFHLETTPQSADDIISNCRDELVAGEFVQSEHALRSSPSSRYAAINALMTQVLTYLTRNIA